MGQLVSHEAFREARDQVMTSFFNAYPEYIDQVALGDPQLFKQNPEAELLRLSEELNIPYEILAQEQESFGSGIMLPFTRPDGTEVQVVYDWSHDHLEEIDNDLISVLVHELGHVLDQRNPDITDYTTDFTESLADAMRYTQMALGGKDINLLSENAAVMDARLVYNRYNNGDAVINALERAERYIIETGHQSDPNQPYYTQNWAKAYEISLAAREDVFRYNQDLESFVRDKEKLISQFQNGAVVEKYRQIAEESVIKHFSPETDEQKKALLDELDTIIHSSEDFSSDGHVGPTGRRVLEDVRSDMREWLEGRQGFILNAPVIINAWDYLASDENQKYKPAPHTEFDPVRNITQAYESYLKTGDQLDLQILEELYYEGSEEFPDHLLLEKSYGELLLYLDEQFANGKSAEEIINTLPETKPIKAPIEQDLGFSMNDGQAPFISDQSI